MAKALRTLIAGPTRRAVCAGLAAAGTVGLRAARAEPGGGVSDWWEADHVRVRLIDAGPSPKQHGVRLAGIEIDLDPMYLTYWRSPGDAGVAPVAAFEGSTNVKDGKILFPAPGRFSEDGAEALGYKGGVVFPLEVTPAEPAKPVSLVLTLSFALCERQCLPAQAKCKLMLTGDGQSPEAGLVRDALARVPAPAGVGGAGPLRILSVEGDAGQDHLTVLARTTSNDIPMLFAEAPDPWFVQAGAGLWLNDGSLKYTVNVLARPQDPAPLPVRLTLVGVETAIEVPVTLDAPPPKP
ncbi:protein-disulfide reductase DsbD domain-containing protein [Lichenifustis flavocetrariae]|uniref:Thiol:disulfide interchange protein DsbD N-terminal domain-containing protein n=1 Tax=Lichenifustis flavocetrariae TaxID=2949735 RepID=A0AA41YZ00_9HYPH|nr:protein-disulfide reductase DsbD domain-containing protein [Lichenifustis flavocetrariae]MCW6509885.1 hypothetical protein [Lichenifustis flavocetrariae]